MHGYACEWWGGGGGGGGGLKRLQAPSSKPTVKTRKACCQLRNTNTHRTPAPSQLAVGDNVWHCAG